VRRGDDGVVVIGSKKIIWALSLAAHTEIVPLQICCKGNVE
jgi:hypothetical protein